MKRLTFLAIILLTLTFGAKAQMQDRPRFDPKEMASRMVSELNQKVKLSDSTQDSLKTTFVNFFEEMNQARKSGERPDRAKMEEKRDAKVKKFLTEDQYKIYQTYMEERRKNRMGGHGGPGGPRGDGGKQNSRLN